MSPLAQADLFKSNSPFGVPKREFLPVEEAFIPSVEVETDQIITLRFDIEEGYYLYKDKFQFKVNEESASVDTVDLPAGKEKDDPLFGLTEVYDHDIEVPIKLARSDKNAGEIKLNVAYQGCAEDGICYPPMKVDLIAALPAMQAITEEPVSKAGLSTQMSESIPQQTEATPKLSETDSIAASLASKPLLASLAIFFGFGLALSLTPCVFPMIPILSGILIGQGTQLSSRKSFLVSLAYVLGMAVTYAIVGVIAGVFGKKPASCFPGTLGARTFQWCIRRTGTVHVWLLQHSASKRLANPPQSDERKPGWWHIKWRTDHGYFLCDHCRSLCCSSTSWCPDLYRAKW